MPETSWAAALFPQHTKHSGVAAVLNAADNARNDIHAATQAARDEQVLDELERIEQQDEGECGR
jgi:hypothetical protein